VGAHCITVSLWNCTQVKWKGDEYSNEYNDEYNDEDSDDYSDEYNGHAVGRR
jgi:hypothetical protein